MLTIDFFGPDSDFLQNAFLDGSGYNVVVQSSSSTQIVVQQPTSGAITTLTGTGFTFGASGEITGGTVTGVTFQQGGVTQATFSGITWSAVALDDALDDIGTSSDFTGLSALFSAQDITIDASAAGSGLFTSWWWNNFDITSDIAITGSDFVDRLFGGSGNDTITPGDNGNYDDIIGSMGNDVIDFSQSNVANNQNGYGLLYSSFSTGIAVNINDTTNTGTITSAGSSDTLIDVNRVLDWDTWGFWIIGTAQADTFTINSGDETWMQVFAGGGNDTINLTGNGSGIVRVEYNWDGNSGPANGITVDLTTGIVADDGYGGVDQINVTGTGWRPIEIRATDFADSILGGNGNERFVLRGGNDTLDGGGGDHDLARFDRAHMTSGVNFDLQTFTATGTWDGVAFSHTITNVEEVWGTRTFNDTIRGDAADNYIWARGGDDRISGRDGNDQLYGDVGNDTLVGGEGQDTLSGWHGDDLLDASQGNVATEGLGDFVRPGLGTDTILGNATIFAAGTGINLSYHDVSGVGGITLVVGANGSGTAVSGTAGLVNDNFTYVNYFLGSRDDDNLTGSASAWEGWQGLRGDDTIDGGAGFDSLDYTDDWRDNGTNGINANLTTGTVIDGFGDTDTVFNIEGINGTQYNDTIRGNADANELNGHDGNDTIRGEVGNDTLNGGAGNDQLFGRADRDLLLGGDGDDRLFGGSARDTLRGDNDDDDLFGSKGRDRLEGGAGNDLLEGEGGHDNLFGNAGNDTLNGGAGNDRLTGGNNADTFMFEGSFGDDTIIDFSATNNNEDIDLSGVAAITDYADLLANHIDDSSGTVIIDDGAGNTITLNGIASIAELDPGDFIF